VYNIFYEEPDDDRWFLYDRYPRKVIRRLLRGKRRPGGHTRVFINLCAGLERLGISYRVNDYGYAARHPTEPACILGKPFVLDKLMWRNPIILGTASYSHPSDDPRLLERLPVKKILVPGPWMKDMCRPYWGDIIEIWPVGIDVNLWAPSVSDQKAIDVLLYNKVMWERERYDISLVEPIRATLRRRGHSFHEVRYGFYREEDFRASLSQCSAMIFLCEHETQGIAYQEALSCDVPIFAWDRGGPWRDPSYFPHKVVFGPVTSVPYWDDRCGLRFSNLREFEIRWDEFWNLARKRSFTPRDYILENLTLEKSAQQYVEIIERVRASAQ